MSEAVINAIVNAGSALLGAGVGGVIAYLASMKAARYTMGETVKFDRQRREDERTETHQLLTTRLLVEMRENVDVLANFKPEWGFAPALHDAWDVAKWQVPFPAPVFEAVGTAYAEVTRYNGVASVVLSEHTGFSPARSHMVLDDKVKKAHAALQNGMAVLEAHLGV